VREVVQRLAPAVLKHFIAYGELLYDEAGEALRQSRRRVLGYAVVALSTSFAVALGCAWAIAASWDGPNRLIVVGSLCGVFVFIALIAVVFSRGARPAGQPQPFERLRAEWREDLRELARLDPSYDVLSARAPAGATPRSVRAS
jgi:hypothetical protein